MNDTEILDWLDRHLIEFRFAAISPAGMPLNLTWIDNDGTERVTPGRDLRDCVRGACAGEYVAA